MVLSALGRVIAIAGTGRTTSDFAIPPLTVPQLQVPHHPSECMLCP
jgi:hypothetical protein